MSDLASLMQYAPGSASYMMGQQNQSGLQTADIERQKLQELIAQLQQQTRFNEQDQPGKLEHQLLQNQGLRAGLPGIEADSRLKGTNADLKAGTLQSDIAAGNDTNTTTMDTNKVKRIQNNAQKVYNAALEANNAKGPGASAIALQDSLRSMGVPDGHKFNGMSPQEVMAQAQKTITNTEGYLQAIATQQEHNKGTLAAQQEHSRGAITVEGMRAASNERIADTRAKDRSNFETQFAKIKDPYDRYSMLTDQATKAMQTGDDAASANYTQRAERIKPQALAALQARVAGKVDVETSTKGRIKNIPEPKIEPTPLNPGNATTPLGAASAGAAQRLPPNIKSISDIKAMSPKYAQMDDVQLRALVKQNFGVDLK